jgi:hypothetical protein
MAQCPKCQGEIAMMDVKCNHCGYDFPQQSYENAQVENIGIFFKIYIAFTWIYLIFIVLLIAGSRTGPASIPSNGWTIAFLAWGYMGLACVNFLLSVFLLLLNYFRHALHLFLSALPVMVILLTLLIVSLV